MTDWRPVPGIDGYEVSAAGETRSIDRTVKNVHGVVRHLHGQLLRHYRDDNGRPMVKLGRGKGWRVAHLVLLAFVGPRPKGREACHRNDVPTDNRLENLYWATRSENEYDKVRNGGHHQTRKTACPWGHPYTPENVVLESDGKRRCRRCRNERRRAAHAATRLSLARL